MYLEPTRKDINVLVNRECERVTSGASRHVQFPLYPGGHEPSTNPVHPAVKFWHY